MMQKTFEAADQSVNGIFSDAYVFEMPTHQRPYVWTTDETDDLLRDLWAALKNQDEAYFLGSIVLIRNSDSGSYQVIDGQQRLTTLTMLFCVLRELSDDKDSKDSLDIYVREKGNRFAGSKDRFRLSIKQRDNDFFQENVQEADKLSGFFQKGNKFPTYETDSQKKIFDNVSRLWKQLEGKSTEKRDALSEFIVQRCYFVVVTASDRTSAHRIFSVLNTRGLNLEAIDILKAEVLGQVHEVDKDKEKEYTKKWEDIEEDLGRADFQNLFAHIYVISKKNRHHRELAEAFMRDVLIGENPIGADFIDNVLDPYSDSYQVVSGAKYLGPGNDKAIKEINLYLSYLGLTDNDDWIPPAMEYYTKHKNDDAAILQFLKEFDRLAYSLFIRRVRRDPRINRFAKVLSAIQEGGKIEEPFVIPSAEIRSVLTELRGAIYQRQPWRFTTPLLLRLNNVRSDEPLSEFPKKVTVEHVLPQDPKLDSEWIKWFPNSEEREAWTDRLANLVLLSRRKNSQAQNYDFGKKKEQYFKRDGKRTSFVLTNEVLDESEWTPSVLERRQRALIDALRTEWRLR